MKDYCIKGIHLIYTYCLSRIIASITILWFLIKINIPVNRVQFILINRKIYPIFIDRYTICFYLKNFTETKTNIVLRFKMGMFTSFLHLEVLRTSRTLFFNVLQCKRNPRINNTQSLLIKSGMFHIFLMVELFE